jgi:hypothetical protein
MAGNDKADPPLTGPLAITSSSAPTAVALKDKLYVIFKSLTDRTLFLISSADGIEWSGLMQLPPAITVGDNSGNGGFFLPPS